MSTETIESIRSALQLARERGYREVRLQQGDVDFRAELAPKKKKKKSSVESAEATADSASVVVKSPFVGYVRSLPKPLKVGDMVQEGDVVANVSVLGLMNDIESPIDGEIEEVVAKEGDAVQFGFPLLKVRPL